MYIKCKNKLKNTFALPSLLLTMLRYLYNCFRMKNYTRYLNKSGKMALFALVGTCIILIIKRHFQQMEHKVDGAANLLMDHLFSHSSFCKSKEYEQEWSGHFLNQGFNNSSTAVIPTRIEEAPLGIVPTIPEIFLVEEGDFCAKRPNLKTLAYVSSTIINIEQRALARQNFAAAASKEISVIFIVGRTKNMEEEHIILNESQLYHDIIQGNFTDIYNFLIYKTLNAFYWIKKYCKNVKWVLHADDDVIVDVTKYLHFINHQDNKKMTNRIFCTFYCVVMPQRNGKYAVSLDQYPFSHYPIYCFGYMWFTTMDVVLLLLDFVPQVKYLSMEDVYVTGFLAEKANVQRYMTDIIDEFSLGIIQN